MKTALMGAAAALTLSATTFSATLPACPDTLAIMERVADWQLAHPSKHNPLDWTQGAGYTGFMALGDITASPKYRDAMRAIGEKYEWKFLNGNNFHADDHTIGQMYTELYRIDRDPRMLAKQIACFDNVLANPDLPKLPVLQHGVGKIYTKPWRQNPMRYWWCDALFMAPPALARLTAVTGETKYLDFAVSEWKATSGGLYNETDHLFFRDNRFFPEKKKEKNGKNIYWSRGNGWVMGGLVRTLQVMPLNHPDRPWFEKQFKEMAQTIVKIQPADGAWRASLLDPETYGLPEASGTGFFVYALAWGVNQGLLGNDAKEAALKGWAALCSFVKEDGKLTHVQIIAADPTASVKPDSTEVYGVGAFLCAGSEIYRMRLLQDTPHVTVTVKNDTAAFKHNAYIAVDLKPVISALPTFPKSGMLFDGAAARQIPFKIEGGKLLVQTDALPGGEYAFTAFAGNPNLTPTPFGK